MQSARENLKAALDVIRQATDPIELKRAEEVRTICALQILGEVVDQHASELLQLNQRRQQLLETIHGFLGMGVSLDGQVRKPDASRLVSAALLDQSIDLDESRGEIEAAMAHWGLQLKELLTDPDSELRFSLLRPGHASVDQAGIYAEFRDRSA